MGFIFSPTADYSGYKVIKKRRYIMAYFDPQIVIGSTVVVQGSFTNVNVWQPPGFPGDVSNLVIDRNMVFYIDLAWQLNGVLGNVNSQLNDIDNKSWDVQVYAEKMGPGSDLRIYNRTLTGAIATVSVLPALWKHQCVIPAGTLPPNDPAFPNQSGLFRLCIVVYANTTVPGCHDIIGYNSGPMILVRS
jgi:hypothetical protein